MKMEKARVYYRSGNDFLKKGDYVRAAASYEFAVKNYPAYFKAWCNLGVCYKNLGRLGEAESCYLKAKNLKPNSSVVMNNLGNVYLNMNRLEQAIKFYEMAVKITPDYKDAIYNLGQVHYFTGNHEKAIEYRLLA